LIGTFLPSHLRFDDPSPLFIAIQDRHCVYKGGLLHVGIAGVHTDGLMAGSFMDDLEGHSGLSQPRAERFTEVVPAEILDLRFLKSRLPPLFVIPDSEDHILGSTVRSIYGAVLALKRQLSQLGECVNSYLFNLEEWAGRDQLRADTGVDRQIVNSPVAWHSDHVQIGKRHVQMFSLKTTPEASRPCLFSGLLTLDCDSVLCSTWRVKSDSAAPSEIDAQEKFISFFKVGVLTHTPSPKT
jgi:hypothetical protein